MNNIEKSLFRERLRHYIATRPIDTDVHRWNRASHFRHGLQLDRTNALDKLLTELLTGKKRNPAQYLKKQHDLGCLVANLLEARGHIIHLPMSRNSWTANPFRTAGHFVPEAVHLLVSRNLIGIKLGSDAAHRYTRIWATERLLEMFAEVETEYTPPQYVVLKNRQGDQIDYQHTKRTREITEILSTNHQICQESKIMMPMKGKVQKVSTALHAVFLNDWSTYGRLHTATRRGYQNQERKNRPSITINGEQTVELDYSGLHPRVLYAWQGVQYDGDPYTAVSDNPELRSYLKVLMLALLNSDSVTKAIQAGNYQIYDRCLNQDFKLYHLLRRLNLKSSDLIRSFQEAHPKIAPYFGQKDLGLRLMNFDSNIALDIIQAFNKHELPILAIHDSFIVSQSHQEQLHYTMLTVYQQHTNGFSCPIK